MIQQTRALCLASSSPRRQEMLRRYQLQFTTYAPEVDESRHPGEDVVRYVLRVADAKARVAQPLFPEAIILAGDTTVYFQQQVLGKPESKAHAEAMLKELSGQTHEVYSAYTLLDSANGRVIHEWMKTEVRFQPFGSDWIRWYLETGEPLDKAGAYSIQGIGTVMVASIQGSYNNVVGFPMEEIFWHLLQEGWIRFSA